MKHFNQTVAWIGLAALLVGTGSAHAQFGAAPAAQPAGAAAPAAEAPKVNDPRVEALLATNPQTPEDLFGVAMLLVDLKYPQVAKPLFTKLLETAVDDAQLASLGRNVGVAKLYRLAEVKEFQPQADEFIKRVIAATNAANRDPQRLAELIERLKLPSVQERAAAVMALRTGGEAAAQALVDALVDPARAAEQRVVAQALAGLGSEGVGALAVFARSGSEAQRVLALETLGYVDDGPVDSSLYAAALGSQSSSAVKQAAEAALRRRMPALPKPTEAAAQLYLDAKHVYLVRPMLDGSAAALAVWRWNEELKKPVLALVSRRAEALERAATLARTAADIAGSDQFALLLARAAGLESALAAAGAEAAAQAEAVKKWQAAEKPGAVDLERLLEFMAENRRTDAAAAVVRMLAAGAGPAALESLGGKPSILVRMTMQPDRRLRFAALEEILKLQPKQPFAGSSAVADALGYFAASGGLRKALVVDLSPARARDVAGLLTALGYQCETAADARTAVRMVAADADYELLLMYRPFLNPELGQLLAQLRADYRTARLPVAVYCEPDDVERTRSTLRNDDLAAGIYQPRLVDALTQQLTELTPASAALPAAPERLAEARAAIGAIGKLIESKSKIFNTRQYENALLAAAWNPAVAAPALGALGWFGSSAAQRTLTDVAGSAVLPLEQRQQAAKAFCESVIHHGTLLTTSEIMRQYDRYNASAQLDRPTQELLGAILDAVEARAAKLPRRSSGSAAAPSAAARVASPPGNVPSAAAPAVNAAPTNP